MIETSRPKSRWRSAIIAVCASSALACAVGPQAGLASDPLPDAVYRTPQFLPNYFYAKYGESNGGDLNTQVVADRANKVVFEINNYTADSCDKIEAFDADTLHHLADEPRQCNGLIDWTTPVVGGNSKMPALAVDSADDLLFVTDTSLGELIALSERSLTEVAAWSVPSPQTTGGLPGPGSLSVVGMSWSANGDQLLVLLNQPASSGMEVADYLLSDALHGKTQPHWSFQVPGCETALLPYYGESAAFLTADSSGLFVPCQLTGSSGFDVRAGVVSMALAASPSCLPAGSRCPVTDATTGAPVTATAVAPRPLDDVIFDPGSDRILFPTNTSSQTVEAVVYDGDLKPPSFTGTMSTGGTVNATTFAFDPDIGRLYATSSAQITLLDVRRTPFAPGSKFTQYTGYVNYESLPALPADAQWPDRRFIVGYTDRPSDSTILRGFTVFADRAGITTDPPPGEVDSNTYSGPLPLEAAAVASYGASAAGYGVHSDLAGGLAEPANATGESTFDTSQDPFVGGTRDDLMGWVIENRVSNGAQNAAAVAIGAADASSSHDLTTCSDVAVPPNCGPPPPPLVPQPPSQPTPPSSQSPLPENPQTSQEWPWPTASCAQPGPGKPSTTYSGPYYTSYAQGKPQQEQLLATDNGPVTLPDDTASVDCAAVVPLPGSSAANAESRTLSMLVPGVPSVTIADAYSTTSVQPASGNVGPVTLVTSVAEGIHIDLGPTPSALGSGGAIEAIDIGSVQQVGSATAGGRPGTARAEDTVTITDVVLETEAGVGKQLCAAQCPPSVIDTLNNSFPTLLHIMLPSPDESFGARDRTGNLPGSPGGYQAVVQANILEQQGDHQFNDMDPSEAVMLPALRIVLYQDGDYQINREVLDLAGVFAEAHDGISVFEQSSAPPQTPTNVIIEQQVAGVINTTIVNQPPVVNPGPGPSSGGPGGIVGVVEQVLTGLNYLVRSPLATLRMFVVLMVLGLPLLLIIRRRAWLAER